MAQFKDLPRGEWKKDADRRVWRKVKTLLVESYDSISLDDLTKRVEEMGLTEAELEMDVEYGSYGDRDRDNLYLTGWRLVPPNEVKQALMDLDADRAKQDAERKLYEDRRIAELKAIRPELFK